MTPGRGGRAARIILWITLAAAVAAPVALWLLGARHHVAVILFRLGAPPLGLAAVLLLAVTRLRRSIAGLGPRYTTPLAAATVALGAAAFFLGPPRARQEGTPGGTRVELVTFNVLFRGGDPAASLRLVREQDADVLAFQEVTPAWLARLEQELGASHPHHAARAVPGTHGLAVFSRHPLGTPVYLDNREGRAVAQCLPVHAGAGFVLCNVHLASPAAVFRDPAELLSSFERNAALRTEQWRELRALVARSFPAERGRTVVAGDLNTLEVDPLMDEVRRDFVDAFREHHWRLGATFPNLLPFPPFPPMPVARIDYVLVTPAITPEHAEVLPAAGSDHLGVWAVLRVPGASVHRPPVAAPRPASL